MDLAAHWSLLEKVLTWATKVLRRDWVNVFSFLCFVKNGKAHRCRQSGTSSRRGLRAAAQIAASPSRCTSGLRRAGRRWPPGSRRCGTTNMHEMKRPTVLSGYSDTLWHLNFSRTVAGITKWFWVTIEGYLSYLLPKLEDLVPTSLGSGAI